MMSGIETLICEAILGACFLVMVPVGYKCVVEGVANIKKVLSEAVEDDNVEC